MPKCEIFNRSDFHDFYTIKSLWEGDFGVNNIFIYLFRGSFAALKFYTCMLSLIFMEDFFFCLGKIFFLLSYWDHLLASIAIVTIFCCFRYFKNYQKFWIPYVHAPTFMRKLSILVRNWCAPWPYASLSYTHAQHEHQFSYFSNVHFVYSQHARKELMLALSLRVRNWCILWAYASEIIVIWILWHTINLWATVNETNMSYGLEKKDV